MEIKPFTILVPIITVYIGLYIISTVVALGALFYPVYIGTWLGLTFLILAIGHRQGINIFNWRFNRDSVFTAIYIGIIQVFSYFFLGLLAGFGRNPISLAPLSVTITILFFVSILLGTELSRALFLKSFSKRNVFIGFVLSTLVFTVINISLFRLADLNSTNAVVTIGTYIVPSLGMSVLATGLVLLGGPIASLSYLLIVQGFNWLSPILPNVSWVPLALVGTLIPIMGIVVLFGVISPFRLVLVGLTRRNDLKERFKSQKGSYGWLAIASLVAIFAWAQTGALGFGPSVVVSGSMTPAINVGDLVITVETPSSQIHIGDIVEYSVPTVSAPIMHRVIQISGQGNSLTFTTKGDANNGPDPSINPPSSISKATYIIPKIGWVTIYIDEAFAAVISFLTGSIIASIAFLAGIVSASFTGLYLYNKRLWGRYK